MRLHIIKRNIEFKYERRRLPFITIKRLFVIRSMLRRKCWFTKNLPKR